MTRAPEHDWLHRHPALGGVVVGLGFGVLFGAFISVADTHGWRFSWIAGLTIGLVLFAPYVWSRLRRR